MGHTLTLPSGWNRVELRHLFDRITRKNYEKNTNVLTISAKNGLISQKQFFNKNIASEDLSNYCLIQKGDFAYNKSYSVGYGYGAIKRLQRYDKGVVSPLYICFTPNESCICPEFYLYYFESLLLDNEIKKIAQEGARNHGLLNISVNDFFAMPIPLPPLPEQKRIAEILMEQDKLIALKERLIAAKKKQKKWLMQNLLTGKIRLEGFNGKWENTIFQRILVECKRLKSSEELEICSVAVNKGIINQIEHLGRSYAANNTENYHIVSYGDIVYTKSPTGDFPFGIVKQSQLVKTVAVSPLYGVFKPSNYFIGRFLDFYFQSHINSNNYLRKIVNKGAKNTILVNNADFLKGSLKIPNSENEQQNIAERLAAADQEIELLTKELEAQKKVKKYLMQQLLTGKIRVTGGES